MRRAIAGGAALIVVILLFLGVRGCLDARKERAFKDYVRDVAALVGESDQLSDQMFGLLSEPGNSGEVDIQNAFNQYRSATAQLVDRVRDTDHPDELEPAHRYLIEAFEFRRDGVAGIADRLPGALAEQDRREGTEQIAAEMQKFLTSDVIYSQRVGPNLQAGLEEQDLTGEEKVVPSQFLPDIDWLQPSTVSDRISRIRSGGGSGDDEAAAPGLHGNGLGSVSLGGVALAAGGTATVTLSDDLSFDVQVANQGENTETDVEVRVTVGDDIEASEVLDTIAAGETKSVVVPLAEQPPTGEALPISIEIVPVPGEEKTDNNVGEFNAIFTR